MTRRLAAIMAADVVGYSRLVRTNEDSTLAALKALQSEVLLPKITEHHGRVVKLMGDGLLAEFGSVIEAASAAIGIQKVMARRGLAATSVGTPMQIRVGLNLGDVVIDGDDIYGDGVNVAARLEALAPPGGICISRAVHDQVRDRVGVRFEEMGEQQLKNIDRPVRVWRWAPVADARGASPPAAVARADRPLIVVLPFDNMSRDPDQEYFSDGIAEDIITDLSKVSGLFVIARNSAFGYKGKRFSVPEVCRELGVKFALEGSIRKAANRVRVTAQLIDGASGGHLWAERYDRELTDIFEVQDDITHHIVGALKVTLSEAEKARITDSGTRDVNAHDCFLRGRKLIYEVNSDRGVFNQATDCFRRAIEIDPTYAAAYAGLCEAYILDWQNHWSAAPETSLQKAEHFASAAIAMDEQDPFAHFVASLVAMFTRDYERWAQEADKALSLNPNYALALCQRGNVHVYMGEPAKAIPYIERAMRLDPGFQQQYIHFLGTAHFAAGDYEEAAALFRERIRIIPTTDLSRTFLCSTLGQLGRVEQARDIWRELKEINPRYSAAEHVARLPFRDPADAERFTLGLRKAGLA